MDNHRIEQVNSLVKRILAEIIEKDFCLSRDLLISLTRVESSGNLQEANVFISVLPDKKREEIVAALNKEIYIFQEKLNKKLRMRPVPRIIFIGDNKPEEAQKVETILEKLKESRKD